MPQSHDDELLVLGDLHSHFDTLDERFIKERRAAMVLFVGDLGDEDPAIAARIARLTIPFRAILGNHDAWESFRQDQITPALRRSLDSLGSNHLAYRILDMPRMEVTIVGCRPFSWGGASLRSPDLYHELYGITSHEESADKIVKAARTGAHKNLVLLAHNGPRGLGSRAGDIYGKDFGKPGGDWGDHDLRIAIRRLKDEGFRIPLVVSGHMHHRLIFPRGKTRQRCVTRSGTVYTNVARVPRIFHSSTGVSIRHYVSARIVGGKLSSLNEVYLSNGTVQEVSLLDREATA